MRACEECQRLLRKEGRCLLSEQGGAFLAGSLMPWCGEQSLSVAGGRDGTERVAKGQPRWLVPSALWILLPEEKCSNNNTWSNAQASLPHGEAGFLMLSATCCAQRAGFGAGLGTVHWWGHGGNQQSNTRAVSNLIYLGSWPKFEQEAGLETSKGLFDLDFSL